MLGKPVAQRGAWRQGRPGDDRRQGRERPAPTRNVVGIIPGSDPKLSKQYVVIGAHSDHVGMSAANPLVEHDSLKAYNMVARVEGADSRGAAPPTAEQWARINAIKDSLRKIYPARLDSISNGADDDGSGSVSILEIAEAFARPGEAEALADLHLADRRREGPVGLAVVHEPSDRAARFDRRRPQPRHGGPRRGDRRHGPRQGQPRARSARRTISSSSARAVCRRSSATSSSR